MPEPMDVAPKPRPLLPAGPHMVVGLARSGVAIARLLAERGEEVVGVDAGSPSEAGGLAGVGVEVHVDADGSELLARVNTLIKSPGVPREAPVVAAARADGMPVIGELEASWRLLPNPFVAITGTNGKTTVAELAGHLWKTAGAPVAVAGNVGTPLATLVGELDSEATVVCECSSFQLEDTEAFAPECAVLLNISPDHLDRHGTVEDYAAAKLRIFANQGPGDVAIHCDVSAFAPEIPGAARRIPLERVDLPVEPEELGLLGAHNADNARAAAAADAGDVVLLAPACASFDAYRDFEERGDHFRALVGELG
jgi:UDP-N-acetylmuramoylalanine--D-glutamate ligase